MSAQHLQRKKKKQTVQNKVRDSFREGECVIECRELCNSLRKTAQMGRPAFSSDFMPGYTQRPKIYLGRKTQQQQMRDTVSFSLFLPLSGMPRACLCRRKTLTDRHASAAISSKLIVVDWSVIVVGDRVLSSLAPVPERCPEGGMEGWKDGGRAVINTDRGESVLVWGHNNRRGLARPHWLCGWQWAEGHRGLWVERATVTAASKQSRSCTF